MPSLIEHIKSRMVLSDAQLGEQLARRAGYEPVTAHMVQAWNTGSIPFPAWAECTCVQWIMETWRAERDACGPGDLWIVDRKYTAMLEGFTMADIVRMLHSGPAAKTAGEEVIGER